MKHTKWELFYCKLVDGIYISGAIILFVTSLVFAIRII